MAKKKILLIEDEKIIVELLEKKLIQEGYQVVVARDGDKGLEKIREEKPDLILLDIVMPQRDGFQVMEELRDDKELNSIPIVIISNSGQPVELDRAKELGADDWLIKTEFDPAEVLEKVEKNLK